MLKRLVSYLAVMICLAAATPAISATRSLRTIPKALKFGKVTQVTSQTFYLNAKGGVKVIVGDATGPFTIESGGGKFKVKNGLHPVTVKFAPKKKGSFTSTIKIRSDAEVGKKIFFMLIGSADGPATIPSPTRTPTPTSTPTSTPSRTPTATPTRTPVPVFADDFKRPDTLPGDLGDPSMPGGGATSWYAYSPNDASPATTPFIKNNQVYGTIPDNTDSTKLTFYFTPSLDGLSPALFVGGELSCVWASFVIETEAGGNQGAGILLSSVADGLIGIGGTGATFIHAIVTPSSMSLSHWEPGNSNVPMATCSVTGPGRLLPPGQGKPSGAGYPPLTADGITEHLAWLCRDPASPTTATLSLSTGLTLTCDDPAIAADWGNMTTFEETYHNDTAVWLRYTGVWVEFAGP